MRIGIIGAGFTGLSAALTLVEAGHKVVVFEKDSLPGGLALGFKDDGWQWSLEKHFHHWFTNDKSVLSLAQKIGHPVITRRPKTSVYINGQILQLDSPIMLLRFKELTMIQRMRMAGVLAFLRYNPYWKPLEKIKAHSFLKMTMGDEAYSKIWKPQMKNKFGDYEKVISLAWFWARIRKRTTKLSYPEGGFLSFAKNLSLEIKKKGGEIKFNSEVQEIRGGRTTKVRADGKAYQFDKLIVTLPSFVFINLAKGIPDYYKKSLTNLKGLGAINLILVLKEPFLKDGTYWLSVCDMKSPVMAIVEHTNFMGEGHYNNEHLVYLGNYLPSNHPYYEMSELDLLKTYHPILIKINKNYKKSLKRFKVFKVPFAQPIIPVNYSKMIPPFKTPIANVFLANMQQVYPWDRGTNYAVELGEKVVGFILNEK